MKRKNVDVRIVVQVVSPRSVDLGLVTVTLPNRMTFNSEQDFNDFRAALPDGAVAIVERWTA